MKLTCNLCPRNCNVTRDQNSNNTNGFCGQSSQVNLARAALHYWEEPCISGSQGSGAVFFCGCNLRCIFCQNADLANSKLGKTISIERLSEIFIELQEQNAANINLITAGHFIPQLAEALSVAKNQGLHIPVVYNTGSYEKVESLQLLDGLVDIYLPDLKYMDKTLGDRLSNAPDYFEIATKAIAEMYRQVGQPRFKGQLMKKGVIVRHLVLPNHTKDSRKILEYLNKTYADNIYISILNQYTPMPYIEKIVNDESSKAFGMTELTHTLSSRAYNRVIDYALELGINNAFIQEGETFKDSFIPIWDYTGVSPQN